MEITSDSVHFSDRLFRAIAAKGTPLCVGFDPHLDLLPLSLFKKYRNRSDDPREVFSWVIEEFLLRILDDVAPVVAVIKPQFAFFERLGWHGIKVLERVCKEISDRGLIVIGDVKRGDIGSTAKAYADSYFNPENSDSTFPEAPFKLDAVTINPFLGEDSMNPFLRRSMSNGIFVLVKTSNPSGSWLQDVDTSEGRLNRIVARWVHNKGLERVGRKGYSDIGAVVGATYPEDLVYLRKMMPYAPFLIPGFGFQGGRPGDIALAFDASGSGCVVNSSRSILFAYRHPPYSGRYGEDRFAEAARDAARDASMRLRTALANRSRSI